jgi:hypothetical protein
MRPLVRDLFPRKRWRLLLSHSFDEMARAFREHLIDAALIDAGHADDATWQAAALAGEFPSVPFFGVFPLRPGDASVLSRCVSAGCVDAIIEGVDEPVARHLVSARSFSSRFRHALSEPPESLGLTTPVQKSAWRAIVSHAGTPVTTAGLADALGLSREHLSRKFAVGGAPNLKRSLTSCGSSPPLSWRKIPATTSGTSRRCSDSPPRPIWRWQPAGFRALGLRHLPG